MFMNQAKMLEEMDAEFGVGDLINEEFRSIKQKVQMLQKTMFN